MAGFNVHACKTRHLQNFRRLKPFLVDDPAAENSRPIRDDMPRGQQLHIFSQAHPLLRRKSSVRSLEIVSRRQPDQKIRRRNRVSADEYTRRPRAPAFL